LIFESFVGFISSLTYLLYINPEEEYYSMRDRHS